MSRDDLVFYGRYIDDVLLIWDGGPDVFSSFVAHCNNNTMGLSFTHVLNADELLFFWILSFHTKMAISSLGIMSNRQVVIHTFTIQAAIIQPGKNNIPSGQFNRLRRNCLRDSDYISQGRLMTQKFLEKGYPQELAQKAFDQQLVPSRPDRLRPSSTMTDAVRFVTTFNDQFVSIGKITRKHFNILKLDQRLAPLLPSTPQITFRRARTVKNILAPSKLRTTTTGPLSDIRTYFDDGTGVFQCRKRGCLTCQYVKHGWSSISDTAGRVSD